MPSNEVRLPVGELTRGITMHVNVVGFRGWLWRLKIALLLFRLGALIAGVGIRVENNHKHLSETEK